MHARNKEQIEREWIKINEYEHRNVMSLKEAVEAEDKRIVSMKESMQKSIENHEKELKLLRDEHRQKMNKIQSDADDKRKRADSEVQLKQDASAARNNDLWR